MIKCTDELYSALSSYMCEITNTLQNAVANNFVRQEMIFALQQLAKNYAEVKNSSYKSFITEFIIIECNNHCSIHLHEDELKLMWAN